MLTCPNCHTNFTSQKRSSTPHTSEIPDSVRTMYTELLATKAYFGFTIDQLHEQYVAKYCTTPTPISKSRLSRILTALGLPNSKVYRKGDVTIRLRTIPHI